MKQLVGGLRGWVQRIPHWVLPSIGLFGVIFTVFWVRLDPDFGWHLQSGRDILAHGIPAHDIFTYTAAGFPWINHEWLSDVIIVGAYSIGGFAGVSAMFAAIWTGALAVASRSGRWPVLAVGVAAILDTITARPNAWTALFFALVLLAVSKKVYWLLVPLFALWANLHGGFVIGLLVLLGAAVRDRKYRWVFAACVLATFVNPYGPRLYVEIWRTLSDMALRTNVVEWRPMTVGLLSGLFIVIYLVIGSVSGWRQRKFILPSLMLVTALASMRQFPLFVVATLALVSVGYSRLSDFLKVRSGWNSFVAPVLALAVVAVPVGQIISHPDNQSPVAQVAQLRDQPCRGNLFNDYDFGGYLIWQLPQIKIYIDGRMPSWKYAGENYLANWILDLTDAQARSRDFARYDVGCVLIRPKHAEIVRDLKADGWIVTSADAQAILLRRPN
jgi:hypothetical protein